MHRLSTAAAIIVSTVLISVSADARPHYITHDPKGGATAGKSMPKLVEPALKGKVFAMRRARNVNIQWRPGLTSRNVRIMSFPFGVEREMKESGEKGGTADINIGVGELQECTISKSMDAASPVLARLAKTHRPLPQILLRGRDAQGRALSIKMKKVYLTSYHFSGKGSSRRETLVIKYAGLE